MGDRQIHMKFGGNAAASVDAYLEYKRIVGDDDGGVLFTPEQYEEYKKKVLPMRQKNRLFVSWTNSTGMDCKLIGPQTPCFCTHRYQQHNSDFEKIPHDHPILLSCKIKGCGCKSYHYVPLHGSTPIRCGCKHFSDEHATSDPHKCKKDKCKCDRFKSSYTCGCGESYTCGCGESHTCGCGESYTCGCGESYTCGCGESYTCGCGESYTCGCGESYTCGCGESYTCGCGESYTCGCGESYSTHRMIVETKEQRQARGHPVGLDVPYQAMGGLTGFSSLMDGYMRLDPSGIGAPPEEYLNQPITSSDNPFLRANVQSIKAHQMKQRALKGGPHGSAADLQNDADLAEMMSAMKRPGESDMDFYERRYQERGGEKWRFIRSGFLKAEKTRARAARPLPAPNKLQVAKRTTPGGKGK